MPKIGFWKSVLGPKERVPVKVGSKTELLTHTQSYRFDELSDSGRLRAPPVVNPLEDARYSLEDATFRLMLSETDILRAAVDGDIRLYIDMAGQAGRWRRRDPDGVVSKSSVGIMKAGLMKLRGRACRELAESGRAVVRKLDFCKDAGTTRTGIDHDTLENLRAWGPGDTQFFPLHPLNVERSMVVLLPPLK
jgi:hypothetical protein